jgi:hypothetical protein
MRPHHVNVKAVSRGEWMGDVPLTKNLNSVATDVHSARDGTRFLRVLNSGQFRTSRVSAARRSNQVFVEVRREEARP